MTNEKQTAYLKKFGEHIKGIRHDKTMTLLQVSSQCTLEKSKLSNIEHGKVNITMTTLLQLAAGLEIPVADLMRFQIEHRR